MSGRRLTGRDYKGVGRGGPGLARMKDLAFGFAAGLLVALIVYISDHRRDAETVDARAELAPGPHHAAKPAAEAAGDAAGDADNNYDFYSGLAKFEVVVPEKEHGTHVDAAARIDRPGTYFLQAGSYRDMAEANRVQAQLARQSVSANVQRVQLDNDVWYRIRIGPIKDLGQLNRVRQQLQAAEIVTLVIRVED